MVGWAAIGAVLKQPRLWGEALRTAMALARDGWWRKPPFLPIPNRAYMRWRVATAYGESAVPIDPDDLVAYLRWRQRLRTSGAR
jgi:hypothetical protein